MIGAFGAVERLSPRLAVPMADWPVRTAGVLTLAAMFVLAFTTARMRSQPKPEENDENRT